LNYLNAIHIFYIFMFLQIIKQSFIKLVSVLAFANLLVSPIVANATISISNQPNIVGVASASADFSTLVTAVKAAGLVDTLSGNGPFTVFAPTNDAFNKLPAGLLEKLVMPENKTALTKILTYHVVAGKNMAADVIKLDGKSVATVNGATISVKIVNGGVVLNDKVNVTKTDIAASNGVIHVIDQVLVPSDLDLSTLVSKSVTNQPNIVGVASASADFSTLVTAVKAAGLVDTLSGTGPFTVFAPTNGAFAKIPADVLAKLLLPENKDALIKVLTYHVIVGKVDASQVVKLTSAKTVQGSDVKIAVVDSKVKLNDNTTVLTTDIQTSNGIIHSIDSVLLPADLDLTKLVSAKTSPTTITSPKAEDSMKGHTVRTGGLELSSIIALVSIVILGFALRLSLRSKK
jgi:transforming growth factor-beta-induced protein